VFFVYQNKRTRIFSVALCLVFLFRYGESFPVFASDAQAYQITDDSVPLMPSSPGAVTYAAGSAVLDASNVAEGYVTVKFSGAEKAKVQITCNSTYTYNLRNDGQYEVFPLTCGNGSYQVTVYRNITGNQYAQELSANLDVELRDSRLPYLYPNQFVNYSSTSKSVEKAGELAQGAAGELDIVANIYSYVAENVAYDTEKAELVRQGMLKGYVPDTDVTLAEKKGICFDYAALTAAMLRSQHIPARMELGYVSGGVYHAWISVFLADIGWVNAIYFDGSNWKLMDPTFAAGGNNAEINAFIGNASNYQAIYRY
jgi:hypothetical protein